MTIPTVYEKDNCQQCVATKRWLRSQGVPFSADDATEPNNLEAIKALGFLAAPVTIYGPTANTPPEGIAFSGFDPGALQALKAAFEADHPQTELN